MHHRIKAIVQHINVVHHTQKNNVLSLFNLFFFMFHSQKRNQKDDQKLKKSLESLRHVLIPGSVVSLLYYHYTTNLAAQEFALYIIFILYVKEDVAKTVTPLISIQSRCVTLVFRF